MWVLCDLDGTLVDSLGALRAAYDGFLAAHGAAGSPAEFAALNGPALPEIVARLRETHCLAPPAPTLLADYQARLAGLYARVAPCPGAEGLLAGLRADGHRLALVTAAPRSAAEAVMAARGWRFDACACGDEVERAKPAPDLYRLALERAGIPPAGALAIEDSANGIRAAAAAGLAVLAVHGGGPGASSQVPGLTEALAWIRARQARLLAPGPVRIRLIAGEHPADQRHAAAIAALWEAERARRPALHDGALLCLEDWQAEAGGIMIAVRRRPYRSYLARTLQPGLDLDLQPLGVAGVTRLPGGWLVGRRAPQVTAYAGLWETVPSGSLEDLDAAAQVRRELAEEAGLPAGTACACRPLGLLYDPADGVYDVALHLEPASGWQPRSNGEHDELDLLDRPGLAALAASGRAVPALAALLPHL